MRAGKINWLQVAWWIALATLVALGVFGEWRQETVPIDVLLGP